MNQEATSALLTRAAEMAKRYADAAHERRVSPTESAAAALQKFHEPFPEASCDPMNVLEMLDEIGSPATVTTTGGRYFGFVIGGTLPAAMAANCLAAVWGQNAALRVMSPVAAELEEVVIRWVCEALGLPPDCEGGLVTGATMANFTALGRALCAPGARRLERSRGWPVPRPADRSCSRSRSSRLAAEGAEHARPRPQSHPSGGSRSPRKNARGKIAQTLPQHDCLHPGRQRQLRCFRSRRSDLRSRARAGLVGPCRWRVRPVGRRIAEVPAPDERIRARRLLGHRRA